VKAILRSFKIRVFLKVSVKGLNYFLIFSFLDFLFFFFSDFSFKIFKSVVVFVLLL